MIDIVFLGGIILAAIAVLWAIIGHLSQLEWILQKLGIVKKEPELYDIYRTENSIKAFGNALRAIDVPIEQLIKRNEKGAYVLLFRQKTRDLTSQKLKEKGFVRFDKSMGLWVLPPKKTRLMGFTNINKAKQWMMELVGDKDNSFIRLLVIADFNQSFWFRGNNAAGKTFWDVLLPAFVEEIGPKVVVEDARRHYTTSKKKITEREIIEKTPIQHIYANFVNTLEFSKLEKCEQDMLKKLEKTHSRKIDYAFLSRIDCNELAELLSGIGIENDVIEKTKLAINQAKFINDKL